MTLVMSAGMAQPAGNDQAKLAALAETARLAHSAPRPRAPAPTP
jgi:hypothetical protein